MTYIIGKHRKLHLRVEKSEQNILRSTNVRPDTEVGQRTKYEICMIYRSVGSDNTENGHRGVCTTMRQTVPEIGRGPKIDGREVQGLLIFSLLL